MRIRTKRFISAVGVAFAVVVTAAATPWNEDYLNPAAGCVEVKKWVTAHSATLPRTLAELNVLPMNYRRGVFSHLPLAARRSLWHEHLESVLRDDKALSVEQREFIRQTDQRLVAYFADSSGKQVAEDDSIRVRSVRLFGRSRARDIFATLGSAESAPRVVLAASVLDLNAVARAVRSLTGGDPQDCKCSTESDWCADNLVCTGKTGCKEVSGCGTLFLYTCNGFCYNVH